MARHNEHRQVIAQREDRERFRQRRIQQNIRDAAPVVAELSAAGFPVEWVADLFNLRLDYKDAIPILLRWLPKVTNDDVKQDIVRALSVKWAKSWAARPLLEEFRVAQDPIGMGLKWAIANALEVVADDSVFDEIVELVRDKQHGRAREMLAMALGNMRDPRAVDVLIQLLDDDEVAAHAIAGIKKLKAARARPYVELLLNHPKPLVRAEARRTLSKLDKVAQGKH